MGIHNKQFLVGNQPKKILEDWKTVRLKEDLYLSHCPNILVGTAKDLNGSLWYLLGLAVQTEKEKGDPLFEIANSINDNVKELYKSWSGRWVLIGNNEIQTDCCGLLGCFYTKINEERWISNSLAILKEIGGFTPRAEKLKHKFAMGWYPLPLSKLQGIYKLMPSQILDLITLYPRQRALPQPTKGLAYDEILEKVVEKIKLSLVNVSNLKKKIFIPLTSGYDSRLVLAASHYAGIKCETFTQEHRHISKADVRLPDTLSKVAGYRHSYIKKSGFSKEKEELYDSHTCHNVYDADRKMFAHGQWDSFEKGSIIFRGGTFEVARCYYWKKMDSNISVETIISAFRLMYKRESFNVKALSEWVKWVNQTPTEGLDWRDRFFLEQRLGGWLSSVEQSLDLTDTERFYTVNCHDILSLLLSVPLEKRRSLKHHHIDLINKMFPDLLEYPFNPPDPVLQRLQKRIFRISKIPLPILYKELKKRL